MAAIDMALDDIINNGESRRAPGGKRPAATRGRRSEAPVRPAVARSRPGTAPYMKSEGRKKSDNTSHMPNASVADVAASPNPTLKVKAESPVKTVAGAICNVMREAHNNTPPSLLATGPVAINQAMKAIAIARKYLERESTPMDVLCKPVFQQDLRSGSNVKFQLQKVNRIKREPLETDLAAKEKTDAYKLAGAIAGRIRDGEEIAVTTKGPIPVLVAVKALSLANDYLADEEVDISFTPAIVDLENPELRGGASSTYLHFAIVTS